MSVRATKSCNYDDYCLLDWHDGTSGVLGFAKCHSLSGSKCQKFQIRFDTSYTNKSTTTTNWARALSCHETGHAVGLAHLANSQFVHGCMPTTLVQVVQFSTHDIDHLNDKY